MRKVKLGAKKIRIVPADVKYFEINFSPVPKFDM